MVYTYWEFDNFQLVKRICSHLRAASNLLVQACRIKGMKKLFTAMVLFIFIVTVAACSSKADLPKVLSKEGISPYELSESEIYIAFIQYGRYFTNYFFQCTERSSCLECLEEGGK